MDHGENLHVTLLDPVDNTVTLNDNLSNSRIICFEYNAPASWEGLQTFNGKYYLLCYGIRIEW